MGGICIFAIYSADSKLILGATRTLERNRSLISLAKASLRFSLPIRIRIYFIRSQFIGINLYNVILDMGDVIQNIE